MTPTPITRRSRALVLAPVRNDLAATAPTSGSFYVLWNGQPATWNGSFIKWTP